MYQCHCSVIRMYLRSTIHHLFNMQFYIIVCILYTYIYAYSCFKALLFGPQFQIHLKWGEGTCRGPWIHYIEASHNDYYINTQLSGNETYMQETL